MKSISVCAAVAVAAVGWAAAGEAFAAGHKKKCYKVSTTGVMISTPLAKAAAEAALSHELSSKGLKSAGAVKTSCKYEFIVSNCTASQRACK